MNKILLLQYSFEFKRILKMPVRIILYKTIEKFIGFVLGMLLLPLTFFLHLLGYRYITVLTGRIGHLALETDCFLKEIELGILPKKNHIILAPKQHIANIHFLNYLKPHFIILENQTMCFLVRNMSRFGLMRHDVKHYIRNIGGSQHAYIVYAKWNENPPVFKITEEDEKWGFKKIRSLGIPDNSWFVCLHAREGGFSPVDEEVQSYRNCDINNSILAIDEIVKRGGWVIRMGDPTMKPLSKMKNVVDYAHHRLKSDRLDVFLCAKAKFFLGNTSGIALLSTVFGVPCALSNIIPTSVLWLNRSDISIPKIIKHRSNDQILTIEEILNSEVCSFQYNSEYIAQQLIIEENSAIDILLLASEMLAILDKNIEYTDNEIELINYTKKLFTKNHYAYGSEARFAASFLKNHPEFFTRAEPDLIES
jgi:putative glycosyltransferase (TIGR04372 family)